MRTRILRLQMLRETQEAISDLKAGRVVSGEEVMRWLESWGTNYEQQSLKQ